MCCFRLWDAALVFLKEVEASEEEMISLCGQLSGTGAERESFHSAAGLPSLSECTKQAEKHMKEKNPLKASWFYVVSDTPQKAVYTALENIQSILERDDWSLDMLLPYHRVLCSVGEDVVKVLPVDCLNSVLVFTAYVGALLAIRCKYTRIVLPLFHSTIAYMKQREESSATGFAPLTVSFVQEQSESWLVHSIQVNETRPCQQQREQQKFFVQKPTGRQVDVYKDLLGRCGTDETGGSCGGGVTGEFVVTGHNFPAHSATRSFIFNGEPIKGPVFLLEDGSTAVPQAFALMWASVNPFSMLGHGCHMNPF